jgi:hypothetical protein
MSSKDPMSQLYGRLGSIGFTRKYLREVALPEWWDDKIAHNPAGYSEGLLLLSKSLGLDLASLQNDALPVGFRNLGPCKFKKSATTEESELTTARSVATRVAQIASSAELRPSVPLFDSAAQIRKVIFGAGARWIGLSQLADYCWSAGMPVLHITRLPPGSKKMDGLAWVDDGHRAIVVSKKIRFSAWLLFILAHEIGHIAKGHIARGGALVDEEVDRRSTDQEETEANAFALELLTGLHETKVIAIGSRPTAMALVNAALEAGKTEKIDPGHLILNWAYQSGGDSFAIANAALAMLEPDISASGTRTDGRLILYQYLHAYLDATKLPEESYEFIVRATTAEEAH